MDTSLERSASPTEQLGCKEVADCTTAVPKSVEKSRTALNVTASPVHSEGSVLSDSDITNISSANSTIRSDLSGGKQGRTSHKEAIATLDLFLNDVSVMTEKAKLEEEKKQQQQQVVSESQDDEKLKVPLASINGADLTRKWLSMPSVVSEEDSVELDARMQKSLQDVRSFEYDVFSDEESDITAHEKKLKVHAQNKANKVNISMSSQGSDVTSPHMYGLTQLDHLRRFLEQFEQLQQQNSELTKRVTNLECNVAKQTTPEHHATAPQSATGSRRNSLFAFPKDKAKKTKTVKPKPPNSIQYHKDKIKGKTKYLASLPFVLAAKSVDNIKLGSSQNFDKAKSKQARQKKSYSYAADDMEIGKSLHVADDEWRNASVKNPSAKDAEKRFSNIETKSELYEDEVDSPKQLVVEEKITPVVMVTEEASTSNTDTVTDPKPTSLKKVFPLKPPNHTQRSKSEERVYGNTKKMTEWGTLQHTFPVTQIESNEDLLNHLESIISGHKTSPGKKLGFKRPGRSRKVKNAEADNMYLPSTEVPGFASTFLAAHAMANQLTLALNLSDLELLSNPDKESASPPQEFNNQPIRIP